MENKDMTALVPEIDIAPPYWTARRAPTELLRKKIKTATIDIGFFTVVGNGIDFGLLDKPRNAGGAVE